jgi:excisionase family DNA binding protein
MLPMIISGLFRYQDWDDVPLALTVDDVGAVLGISRSAVHRLIRRGGIRAVRISQRRLVVSKDEIRRFLGLPPSRQGPVAEGDRSLGPNGAHLGTDQSAPETVSWREGV